MVSEWVKETNLEEPGMQPMLSATTATQLAMSRDSSLRMFRHHKKEDLMMRLSLCDQSHSIILLLKETFMINCHLIYPNI